MWRSCWLILLCGIALAAPPAVDLPRLERAERLLTEAAAQPARAKALAREAATLMPEGACQSLRAAAATPSKANLDAARRELSTLRRALPSGTAAAPPASDGRAALRQVLARGEFNAVQGEARKFTAPKWLRDLTARIRAHADRIARWWGRIRERVDGFFRRLFSRWQMPEAQQRRVGTGMRVTFLLLAILALLLLLGFVASRFIAYRRRTEARARMEELAETSAPGRPRATPWEQALAEAEALWAGGEQREALRVVLRACLLLLDSRGVLHYDESRANGEVLRELRRQGQGDLHGRMRVIVRTFDRGWYGFLPVTGDEFSTMLDTGRRLRLELQEERG